MAQAASEKEVTVYEDEVRLLRKIAETSSDYIKAHVWPEFADHCGGLDAILDRQRQAVLEWETWLDGFEQPET